jgi:hypothetical protein
MWRNDVAHVMRQHDVAHDVTRTMWRMMRMHDVMQRCDTRCTT